jgi:hypothetical protein
LIFVVFVFFCKTLKRFFRCAPLGERLSRWQSNTTVSCAERQVEDLPYLGGNFTGEVPRWENARGRNGPSNVRRNGGSCGCSRADGALTAHWHATGKAGLRMRLPFASARARRDQRIGELLKQMGTRSALPADSESACVLPSVSAQLLATLLAPRARGKTILR